MDIRCDKVTRGSGKIYARFSWGEPLAEGLAVRVHAASRHTDPLPALAIVLPGREACVVVLAIFDVAQTLEVEVLDTSSAAVVATARRRVAPLSARLRSSVNSLRKDREAEAIRNLDERSRERVVDVRFGNEVFYGGPASEIMHGAATLAGPTRESVGKELSLRFFDAGGTLVDGGSWTVMGDTVKRLPGVREGFVREVSFSVRAPRGFTSLACWASFAQEPGHEAERIVCQQPFEVSRKRDEWNEATQSAQDDPGYERWFLTEHRVLAPELEFQRRARFDVEPLFSIVVPLYRTPVAFFREMVESVLGQSYGRFELVLVNASPQDGRLRAAVDAAASRDARVRVVELSDNLGIVGNTYRGVAEATGDFISFFDHDDVLEPDLLYRYVEGINAYPDTDLLYCDEDKLCEGHYLCPYFKPDWNPDLLCSSNYVCHMLTVRASIVDMVAPMEPGVYDGSQDHFLTLFAGEHARNVYHARRVLYHWRMHAGSTAAGSRAKSYTEQAGIRAVQAHLDRCGIDAVARPSGIVPNTYHVDYLLDEEPLVSIIIPNKDAVGLLSRCVDSVLHQSSYRNFEVVVVENNSTEDETFAYYRELEASEGCVRVVRLASDGTFNFSRVVNFGVSCAHGSHVVLLNNDTEVIAADWLERLLGPLTRPEVGVVGAKLVYPDGLIQHAGVAVNRDADPYHLGAYLTQDSLHYFSSLQLTADCTAVTGACLMVRKSLFDALGGFDEGLPVDYNDVDFCLRARAGGKLVVYEPAAQLTHYESVSRGVNRTPEQLTQWYLAYGYLMRRWTRYFAEGDPYLNPNLDSSKYRRLRWRA